ACLEQLSLKLAARLRRDLRRLLEEDFATFGLGLEDRVERLVPAHLDDVHAEQLCAAGLRERERDLDDIGVDTRADQPDEDASVRHAVRGSLAATSRARRLR